MTHYPVLHPIFEFLAYFIGFRFYLKQKSAFPDSPIQQIDQFVIVLIGMLFGAVAGAKLLVWAQDPASLAANWPVSAIQGGKTIVGGILGGLVGVELAKKIGGIRHSTGDAFALPLLLGIVIGRVGCFMAGLADGTHGVESNLPWAYDYGDGVRRHPTQLYEIVFLLAWFMLLYRRKHRLSHSGDLFKAAVAGYLLFRLLAEFIKPMPVAYFGWFSAIQLACLAWLIVYAPHWLRIFRQLLIGDKRGK